MGNKKISDRPGNLTNGDSREPKSSGTQDERLSGRTRAVLRVVKVRSLEDEGLARLHNISDGGMMLRLSLPVCLGDMVTVHLADQGSVSAKVVWTKAEKCGVRFHDTVDSAALLLALAEQVRDGAMRPVRLSTDVRGVAYTPGIHSVRIEDVSQRGMKVRHRGAFVEGVPIKILLQSGLDRRGVVRWSRADVARIQLLDPVSVEELGSSKLL